MRKKSLARGEFFLVMIFIGMTLPLYPTSGLEPLRPLKTDVPPVIDGVLDDPIWKKAPHETGFKTWSPDYGINMEENTIDYYAYDRDAFFPK